MFIRNLWYVAAWSHDLDNEPLGCVITGVPVVLYRRADGVAIGLEDRCPHRFAPLSNGRIEGDNLRCMYHGLRFGCDGVCNEMPARDQAPPLRVRTFPVVERWDWVWVWMGDPELANPDEIPEAFGLQGDYDMRSGAMDYDANWELINDNLCDLSHLDFSHETTLGAASGAKWSPDQPTIETLDNGLRFTRWFPGARLSASSDKKVDTYSSYRYLLPGLFLMTTELYPVGSAQRYDFGAPEETPMSRRVEQQAVTPMTEERTRYFFASGFAAGTLPPKLLQAAFEVIDAAFAEDKQIIEGQQRIINLTPADERMFATPHDRGVYAFRKLVRERIAIENEAEANKPNKSAV